MNKLFEIVKNPGMNSEEMVKRPEETQMSKLNGRSQREHYLMLGIKSSKSL